MRIALLSDIHANLEALEAAAAYLDGRDIQKIAVLGDTVGYGANPNECMEWAFGKADIVLMGNHEKAVFDPEVREWFNPEAKMAIVWTEQIMSPALKEKLRDLAYVRLEPAASFAHGSLHDPEEFHYLTRFQDAEASFRRMESRVCFVGHTHVPCVFCELTRTAESLKPGLKALEAKGRYILNPGSVGQPRDHDPRLSFGIFDEGKNTFEIVRLEYDNLKAAAKIRRSGLPFFLADRLL